MAGKIVYYKDVELKKDGNIVDSKEYYNRKVIIHGIENHGVLVIQENLHPFHERQSILRFEPWEEIGCNKDDIV